MKLLLPGKRIRRRVNEALGRFFDSYQTADFDSAIDALCAFHELPRPRIEWYEWIDWGKSGGRTYEDGVIHLVHPENWKRGTKYNTKGKWTRVVYHEMGHYVLWADAERKAELYARLFVEGIR